MELLGLFICNLCWCVYAVSEGVLEAYLKHKEKESKNRFDFNILLILERILMFITSFLVIIYLYSDISILNIISMIFIFIYINNSIYFIVRNKLNPNIFKLKERTEIENKSERPLFYLNLKQRKESFFIGLFIELVLFIII